MKKAILPLMFMVPLFVAAQDVKKHSQPVPTKDVNILDVTANKTTAVVYETPKELLTKIQREARLKKWNETMKKEELAKVPTGGFLQFDISRYSVASADAKLFTILVLDATGNEKLRTKIDGVVSSAIIAGVSGYKTSGKLVLDQPLKTGDFVCVLDEKENKRYEFLVKND